jgi:hypothetical protein
MLWVRRRPLGILSMVALAMALAACGSGRSREERETRINVYPDNYRADLLAALHTYVSDPANIRDAYVSEPAVRPVGTQNRYVACVQFNSRNSDGRYTGNRDVVAIFAGGRFDQFVDTSSQFGPANQANPAGFIKELCGQAEYKRFPELEALRR